jgi:hypothetical protein
MVVSAGFTILAFSRHATLLPPYGCSLWVAYQCVTVPPIYVDKISRSGRWSYRAGMQATSSRFFHLGSRWPSTVSWHSFSESQRENSAAHFTTSSPRVCPRASWNVSLLPRHSSCPLLHSLMSLLSDLPGPLQPRPLNSAGTALCVNCPWCLMTGRRSSDRSFRVPTISTATSLLGTSWFSTTISILWNFLPLPRTGHCLF